MSSSLWFAGPRWCPTPGDLGQSVQGVDDQTILDTTADYHYADAFAIAYLLVSTSGAVQSTAEAEQPSRSKQGTGRSSTERAEDAGAAGRRSDQPGYNCTAAVQGWLSGWA